MEQRPAEQRPAEQRSAEQRPAEKASTESSTPSSDPLQGVALPVSRTARVTNDAPVAVVSTAGLSIPAHPTVRLGFEADEWYGTVFAGVENPSERGFILASVAKVLPRPPRGDYCFAVDGSVFGTHFLELAMTANQVSARPWVQLLVRTPEGKLGALPVRYRSFPEDPTPRGRHIDGHYLQLILQKDHVEVLLSGAQKTSTATTCGKLAERRPPTPAFFDALAACAKETRRASGDVPASIIPGPRVPMVHIVSALDALRGSDKPQFTNISLVLR